MLNRPLLTGMLAWMVLAAPSGAGPLAASMGAVSAATRGSLASAPEESLTEDTDATGGTSADCFLGLLADPDQPGNPRIVLNRRRSSGDCDVMVLDTGYSLTSVPKSRDRSALERGEGRFSCLIQREERTPLDWEVALSRMLSPGLRGEALLHLGQVRPALEAFLEGLPNPLSAAWLKEAARNLPVRVAELLPRFLKSRDPRISGSALGVLGDLVSSHPRDALEPLRAALRSRHAALRPRALLLSGEEAAGLRAERVDSPEAASLAARIEKALSSRRPATRAAAGEALLLAEPDPRRAVDLLDRAARKETDDSSRALLLSALLEAGGVREIFTLTHSPSQALRRAALWSVSGLTLRPEGESDPLLRLLRDEKADPGEVVRSLSARSGSLAPLWVPWLREILPGLGEEELARVPGLICSVQDPAGQADALALLMDMVREERSPLAGAAAAEALGGCGEERRQDSLAVLLSTAGDGSRDETVRTRAVTGAATLAVSSEDRDQLLHFLRDCLDGKDDVLRSAALDGLILMARREAVRPASLLAGVALRTPPDTASRAAEQALLRMFETAPGPVTRALRELGRDLPREDQGRVFDLFQSLKPEKRDRILRRWHATLSAPGARVGPELEAEMRSLADYWPGEILDLVEPAFQASRGDERIRLLGLMMDLGRLLPDRVLPLLTLPDASSPRLAEATREARAAASAWKILAEPARGPETLYAMALDPLDSRRREFGRMSLWVMALESFQRRATLVAWARATRGTATLPLRVELGRWLAQVSEMDPRRIPAAPERPPGRLRARFLPGTSGDSGPAPPRHLR